MPGKAGPRREPGRDDARSRRRHRRHHEPGGLRPLRGVCKSDPDLESAGSADRSLSPTETNHRLRPVICRTYDVLTLVETEQSAIIGCRLTLDVLPSVADAGSIER